MAIRDDFTAGEVLAAADLNDTFASKPPFAYGTATPSTTVEGFIWYDENSTPPTAKFWDGSAFENVSAPSGLTHINTTSFSAVSSVSFNDIFTSTYDNYFAVIELTASTDTSLLLRMRLSGTDNTANSYERQRLFASAGTVTGARDLDTLYYLSSINTSRNAVTANIFSPNLAQFTQILSHGNYGAASSTIYITSGAHEVATAHDGMTIYPTSGTITGNIRIYGYKNS